MDINCCPRCGCPVHLEEKKSANKVINSPDRNHLILEAAEFIKPLEGFVSTPFWDYKQWSWGYGTSAGTDPNKKPAGTISKLNAHEGLVSYLDKSFDKISNGLNKAIKAKTMIALLSFDYNLGYGNTEKIIERINKGQSPGEIAAAFKLYIYAGGSVEPALVSRRSKEAALIA